MCSRLKAILPKLASDALVMGLLMGCSLAPPYERSPAPIPEAWTNGTENAIRAAFHEVSDALAAIDTLKREEIARTDAARASDKALALSEARYRGGLDDHLHFLEAQRNDYASQMALIDVQTQRQIALSSLFRALGGGWLGDLSPEALPAH